MDKQKIIIGTGLIATALYLSSTGGETYQTGAGSLGSDLMGGGGSDGGLSEVEETPDSIIDNIKKSFNWPTDIFDKKNDVAQNYTDIPYGSISDVGMGVDYPNQDGKSAALATAAETGDYSGIFGGGNGKGTGKVTVKKAYGSISDVGMGVDYPNQDGKSAALATAAETGDYSGIFGVGNGKGTGKVTVKKQVAGPKKKVGTDVFGRSPIKKKKYKNR
jgi:hypothetical protein